MGLVMEAERLTYEEEYLDPGSLGVWKEVLYMFNNLQYGKRRGVPSQLERHFSPSDEAPIFSPYSTSSTFDLGSLIR